MKGSHPTHPKKKRGREIAGLASLFAESLTVVSGRRGNEPDDFSAPSDTSLWIPLPLRVAESGFTTIAVHRPLQEVDQVSRRHTERKLA